MAGLSPFFATDMLSYGTGQVALSTTLSTYLGLFTTMPSGTSAGVEVASAMGYARIAATGTTTWAAPVSGSPTTVTTKVTLAFPTATALSPPSTPTLSSVSGGTIAATTYYVKITYLGGNGETTPSSEASLAVAADFVLVVDSPSSETGATGWNVYVSTASGTETLQNSTPIAIGTNWTEPTSGLVTGSSVPSTNTASWGNIVGVGLFDASTAGDLIMSGWLGPNNWYPFTAVTGSPGTISAYGITAGTSGFANGSTVVISEAFGGLLPAGLTGNTLYSVAGLSSDVFNVGTAITANGSGLIRQVNTQSMAPGNDLSIPSGTLIFSGAT